MNLVEVFKETQRVSKKFFKSSSELYSREDLYDVDRKINIEWEYNDTVNRLLSMEGHVAVLSYADAYDIGGLVWQGATTQEECLCRCSNLYETLNEEFYPCDGKLIYSKDVVFFRDSEYNFLPPAALKKVDVISCAAPVRAKDMDEVKERMRMIIRVAKMNGADTLLLGKWGCGAFGNDWNEFKLLWEEVIAIL